MTGRGTRQKSGVLLIPNSQKALWRIRAINESYPVSPCNNNLQAQRKELAEGDLIMKKKMFSISVVLIILMTVAAAAKRMLHLSLMSSDNGINSYILTDSATNRDYIVVESKNGGVAITPRLK